MKKIKLTRGYETTVDDEDYAEQNQWKWSTSSDGYVIRNSKSPNRRTISMHRQLMNVTDTKIQVDHINGNKLDNRKVNLRICTQAQNLYNRGKQNNNTSGYNGVTWSKQRGKWLAQIRINRIHYYLGCFTDPIDAAISYDQKAIELHGKFANLNFERVNKDEINH